MGSPGAGKTSVSKKMAVELKCDLVDVDNDLLEPTWEMSVADKVCFIKPILANIEIDIHIIT